LPVYLPGTAYNFQKDEQGSTVFLLNRVARQANVCEEDIILGASRCGLKNTLESQTTT